MCGIHFLNTVGAVPYLSNKSLACQWRHRLIHRPVHVGFVVDEVLVGCGLLQVLLFSTLLLLLLRTHSVIHHHTKKFWQLID